MAGEITFIAPDGTDHAAPEPEWLRELVLGGGDEYWQAGSGDAALWYDHDEERRSRLLLMGHEPEGFFLLYEAPGEGGYYCPAGGDEGSRAVTLYVGGEGMEVPAGRMVPKEAAWEVVDDFLRDGGRSRRLEWEPWR